MALKTPESNAPYLGNILSRRTFLGTAAGIIGGVLFPLSAQAADRPIHELRGNVKVNGKTVDLNTVIHPGDTVVTGADGYIVFVIGTSAFMLRSRSELRIEMPKAADSEFGLLKLITGALGAVFQKGTPRNLTVINATIGIRGTGVYLETRGEGAYICTCFGQTELAAVEAPREREWVEATHHAPRLIGTKRTDGSYFMPAPFETHTDAEMEMLERCVGRQVPWVKTGKR